MRALPQTAANSAQGIGWSPGNSTHGIGWSPGNSTHGSGWIVRLQPTVVNRKTDESHQRQLVEVSLAVNQDRNEQSTNQGWWDLQKRLFWM